MPAEITLETVYSCAYGSPKIVPYPFQRAIAESPNVDVLIAPTGLGKTAAVTLGWAWRRLTAPISTPRRLIWCLPMRALVEQTAREAKTWMGRLGGLFADSNRRPRVHVLMGGSVDQDWRLRPEEPAILVGTQDMLLSRALMRGYGMSRFGWPIDYGLMHSDSLWVFDEVQLMGAGLATSAQLEAFRRRANWRCDGLARSLWISATLDPDWLGTAEFRSEIPNPVVLRWNDGNPPEPPELSSRLDAVKHLSRAETFVTVESVKKPKDYARALAREVASVHRKNATTLVIVNTVRRAQALYGALADVLGAGTERLLLHSRYRPPERRKLEEQLRAGVDVDRIVVATQAVEAGVDMTSAVLFTELAPWSSMVQRFGRCNRRGELNAQGGAQIRWVDIEDEDATSSPYGADELNGARSILESLSDVSPRRLPPPSRPAFPSQIIRPKDFEELFDTDTDLSGYDLDVSPYVRDSSDSSVSLFWRTVGKDERIAAESPQREELCPAPLGKDLQTWLLPKNQTVAAYVVDPLASDSNNWVRLDRSGRRLRPGLILLLDREVGGYDAKMGFIGADGRASVGPPETLDAKGTARRDDTDLNATTEDDRRSLGYPEPVPLELHLSDVAGTAREIAKAVGLPSDEIEAVARASAWHDLGKAFSPFQTLLGRVAGGPLLAKSGMSGAMSERRAQARKDGLRRYFRHELASALGFLQQHDGEVGADLVAFLIAAHHGKVRMGLRTLPDEERSDDPTLRVARGVLDGDVLPGLQCGQELSTGLALDLSPMDMGDDERGRPSWSARMQALLAAYGPFRLAYLEALVRMADWRASAAEQKSRDTP